MRYSPCPPLKTLLCTLIMLCMATPLCAQVRETDRRGDFTATSVTTTTTPIGKWVVDNRDASPTRTFRPLHGNWSVTRAPFGRWNPADSRADCHWAASTVSAVPTAQAEWAAARLTAGECAVWAWWPVSLHGCKSVSYTILHTHGRSVVTADQSHNGGQWNYLGSYTFADFAHRVQVHNGTAGVGRRVFADAIRFTWGAGSSTRLLNAGLAGTYFNDTSLSQAQFTRRDPLVQFNWGLAAPAPGVKANQFSVRWTGYLRAPATGPYTFSTVSDDGVRVYVNDLTTPLIDDWSPHTLREATGVITLTAGALVPIKIEYFDQSGPAKIIFRWTEPGVTGKALVPSGAFWTP